MMQKVPNLKPTEVAQFQGQIVDIRDKIAFSKAHIAQSINIPFGPSFAAWAQRILAIDSPLLIVSDHYPIDGVVEALRRIACIQISGILTPFELWEKTGLQIGHLKMISITEVKDQMIIDVRTHEEWNEGHIPQALHIQIEELNKVNVSKDQEIAVICASGNRASIFASLLKKEGYQNVANVEGGMMAWIDAGLPIKKHIAN